jgi:glycosyltransferase involved in cell wall biosynthesis
MKKVSIVIPTYKSSGTLERAINSCINQTYKNIEIIVVDDNEPGSSYRLDAEKIMANYINDCRIIYAKHRRNMNGSAARNTGLKKSTGEYICFLDDDDYFLDTKIRKQVNLLNSSPIFDAVSCYWYSRGKLVALPKKDDFTLELLTGRITPNTCSIMIRRSALNKLNGFDEEYLRHQDYEFLLRFFIYYKIGIVHEPLLVLDTNGVSNRPSPDKLEDVKVKLLADFSKLYLNDRVLRKKVIAANYVEVMLGYIKLKDNKNTFRIFNKLFINSPRYAAKYIFISFYNFIKFNWPTHLAKNRDMNG